MSSLLLITKRILDRPKGGREMLCKLNHDCLSDVFGERLSVLELDPAPITGARGALAALGGQIDGITPNTIERALALIEAKSVGCVFIDGSNLGEMAARLKARAPWLKITTFFHNVEARFFLGALRATKSARAAAVLAVNYLAERKAVRHSDALIAMTEQDAALLGWLYGRRATEISAIALDDRNVPAPARSEPQPTAQPYALFVGGAFYANRFGIAWFIEQVAPRLRLKTVVVGKGMEKLDIPERARNHVVIVGGVECVADWYRGAECVVAPIFDGSGMKTKVAEAMMFGRRVIGTPAAFAGYEDVVERVGWVCRDADEFVEAIDGAQRSPAPQFDSDIHALFDRRYSFAAARGRLAAILEPLTGGKGAPLASRALARLEGEGLERR